MTNIFFVSNGSIDTIHHCKISGKFDNSGKGKIRLAIRFLVEIAEKCSKDINLYVFIKNDEKTLKLEELDQEYNKEFNVEKFRSTAGTGDRFQKIEDVGDEYIPFKIDDKTFENPMITGREVIFPKEIKCSVVRTEEIPDEIESYVNEGDILIRITFSKNERSSHRMYIFQTVIILENFLPLEEIEKWKVPSKVWSANFNIHETIGYERLVKGIEEFLKYPDILELWMYLPTGHEFVASSPIYRKVFKLEASDVRYRTSRGDEFLSEEGDLAVKLMNNLGEHEKYSVICVSPHMIEEKIETLVEEFLNEEKKSFVTWGEFIQPLALLVGLFSLVIGVVVILAVRSIPVQLTSFPLISPSSTGVSINIEIIVAGSIFFAFSTWAVFTTMKNLTERFNWMGIVASTLMILLGISGHISVKYQDPGYIRDMTFWFFNC